jgi:hypothetical protein
MSRTKLLSLLAIIAFGATMLQAQATRTWISGVGDDANPCSRTAPCKTFAGAISKTAAGGEIDALDPGGFGALTITKSITLDGGGGQVASVLVAGTNGIVVAAGPTDVVILRNLRIDGLLGNGSNAGNAGLNGIRFISGKSLVIENVNIFGFNTSGIDLEPSNSASVKIINTSVENTGSCVPASCAAGQGVGIFAKPSAGTLKVAADHTTVTGSSNNGIESGTGTVLGFDDGAITFGNNGATTSGGVIVMSHTTIAYNTATAYNAASGGIFVFSTSTSPAVGTNHVHDNGSTGTPTYILGN